MSGDEQCTLKHPAEAQKSLTRTEAQLPVVIPASAADYQRMPGHETHIAHGQLPAHVDEKHQERLRWYLGFLSTDKPASGKARLYFSNRIPIRTTYQSQHTYLKEIDPNV